MKDSTFFDDGSAPGVFFRLPAGWNGEILIWNKSYLNIIFRLSPRTDVVGFGLLIDDVSQLADVLEQGGTRSFIDGDDSGKQLKVQQDEDHCSFTLMSADAGPQASITWPRDYVRLSMALSLIHI